ncbi:MAG: VIT1/CCC1 transporter family protein [Actinobacteria bacterium]|nr:VIT1/CCC1 transporter family protein [Actinomycetota bacterium]
MHEHHHRDVQGGAARAAVFGASDGLVSNVSLILGVAGAGPAPGIVRLAGLAGLIAGAFSMASGEYVSMKAQTELLQRELALEEGEIHRHPDAERRELAAIYRQRGIAADMADQLATEMHRDPQTALETHAREELGIDPAQLGSPPAAALSSFIAFGIGALVPLLPWFFDSGNGAVVASVLLGTVSALLIGLALARFTGRSMVRSALRQLGIAALAAGVTYAVGRAVGVQSAT